MAGPDSLYYTPEKFGLLPFGDVNVAELYEYDIFGVWENVEGMLFYGTDSGTSYMFPFEDKTPSDLTQTKNPHEVISALVEWAGDDKDQCFALIEKLRRCG